FRMKTSCKQLCFQLGEFVGARNYGSSCSLSKVANLRLNCCPTHEQFDMPLDKNGRSARQLRNPSQHSRESEASHLGRLKLASFSKSLLQRISIRHGCFLVRIERNSHSQTSSNRRGENAPNLV